MKNTKAARTVIAAVSASMFLAAASAVSNPAGITTEVSGREEEMVTVIGEDNTGETGQFMTAGVKVSSKTVSRKNTSRKKAKKYNTLVKKITSSVK